MRSYILNLKYFCFFFSFIVIQINLRDLVKFIRDVAEKTYNQK